MTKKVNINFSWMKLTFWGEMLGNLFHIPKNSEKREGQSEIERNATLALFSK